MITPGTDPTEYDMKCNDCGDIFWNLNGRFCPSCNSKNISDYVFESVEKYNEYAVKLYKGRAIKLIQEDLEDYDLDALILIQKSLPSWVADAKEADQVYRIL